MVFHVQFCAHAYASNMHQYVIGILELSLHMPERKGLSLNVGFTIILQTTPIIDPRQICGVRCLVGHISFQQEDSTIGWVQGRSALDGSRQCQDRERVRGIVQLHDRGGLGLSKLQP